METWPQILEMYDAYKITVDNMINDPNKKIFTMKEYNHINGFIAFSCYVLQEPRRIQDYSEMKIRNYTDKDNYIDLKKKVLVFNKYKTSAKYGTQILPLSEAFQKILSFWILLNSESDYLLNKSKGRKLTQSDLTKLLNRIFDSNISADLLRHIYITHLYGGINLDKIEATATAMAHSPMMSLQYIRHVQPVEESKKKKPMTVINADTAE